MKFLPRHALFDCWRQDVRSRFPSRSAAALALLVLSTLGLNSGCNKQPAPTLEVNTVQQEKKASAVEVTTVGYHVWPQVVRAQGSLVADDEVILGAKVAGRVERVTIDLGSPVKKNDELVVLDTEEFQLAVRQAEAQLMQALQAVGLPAELTDAAPFPEDQKNPENSPLVEIEAALLEEAMANRQRGQQLSAMGGDSRQFGAITRHEMQRLEAAEKVARSRYEAAINQVREKLALIKVRRAELAVAKQQLSEAVIKAPFDGLVLRRYTAPGAYLQVGQSAVTIVRTDPLRYRGSVPERKAMNLRLGQQVFVRVAGMADSMPARITRISPSLDVTSRSLMIEADIANPEAVLRTGLFAEAEIVVNPEAETLAIPESAMLEFAGIRKVWVVEDGKSVARPVLTGRHERGMVEILSGLKPGESIIYDGSLGVMGQVQTIPHNQGIAASQEAG